MRDPLHFAHHDAVEIQGREQLESWLIGQEPKVAWAIALRTALRVLPVGLDLRNSMGGALQPTLTATLFRCCSILWIVCKIPTQEITGAIGAAYNAANAADGAYAATAAVNATARAAASAANAAARPTANAAYVAAHFAANAATDAATVCMAIEGDCNAIAAGTSPSALLAGPLWYGTIPDWAQEEVRAMEAHLADLGDGFDLWTAWYRRRLIGNASGFGLPANGEEDLARRLISQFEDWWQRKHALVNGDIKTWVEELTPLPDFDTIKPRMNVRITSQFGSDEEQNRRAALQERIEALRLELEGLDPPPAAIGHNRPPIDLAEAEVEHAPKIVQDVRDLTVALATELQPTEPDIPVVLEKLSRLQKISRWLADIGNVFAEEAAKSAGKSFGPVVVGGLGLWLASLAPGLKAAVTPVLQSAWAWLQSFSSVI